ncbi:MAG: fimbrial protein [Chania sp.]
MKKIFCVTTLVAASLGLSAGASAADGQVNFEGQLITEACQVVNNMSNPAEVPLGQVAASAFTKKGDTASPQKFILSLRNCPLSASAAQVSFDGNAVIGDNSALALTQVANMATGVAVQISDTSAVLPLRTPSAAYPLTAIVVNDLAFVARYVATSDTVTPGPANAVATFGITYN